MSRLVSEVLALLSLIGLAVFAYARQYSRGEKAGEERVEARAMRELARMADEDVEVDEAVSRALDPEARLRERWSRR